MQEKHHSATQYRSEHIACAIIKVNKTGNHYACLIHLDHLQSTA